MVGILLPLSSSPVLSLLISIAMILFLRAFDRVPWRMLVSAFAAIFALVIFFALVDAPLTPLIQNLPTTLKRVCSGC